MSYYFNKTLRGKNFDDTIEMVTNELKKEGFGVLTEINITETFKKKLAVDFKKYRILGACSPPFAYKALLLEDKVGAFLPCNIVVEEHENGEIEVSAVDPVASMLAVNNEALNEILMEVQQKLISVIEKLG